jgi:hypothetical protein
VITNTAVGKGRVGRVLRGEAENGRRVAVKSYFYGVHDIKEGRRIRRWTQLFISRWILSDLIIWELPRILT